MPTCKGCGAPFRLGWKITNRPSAGGAPRMTIAGSDHGRGVKCKSCTERRLAELTKSTCGRLNP